ncbi:hypothetical protein B5G34_05340 [Flavonifractor sp. An82]|nr:hypothetical protein B5G34_05340 [Flavonifractor sp. An82]
MPGREKRCTLSLFRRYCPARPCLKIGDMPSGEGFWLLASNFFAGILTDFKKKLGRPAGKKPADWAC